MEADVGHVVTFRAVLEGRQRFEELWGACAESFGVRLDVVWIVIYLL